MQGADVLLTIAEVAVAFAGFASIVVLFQHRDPQRWSAAVIVRLRTMIEASLVTLLATLLPFLLHHLGMPAEPLWAFGSGILAVAHAAFGGLVWQRSRAPLAGGELSRTFSTAVGLVTALVCVALVLNAGGLFASRAFGVYLIGVTWALAFASLMFLRLVASPSGPSRGPSPPDGVR